MVLVRTQKDELALEQVSDESTAMFMGLCTALAK
jgi:hypothetical protein